MTYFEGFIVPVPEANKDAYRKHATNSRRYSRSSAFDRMVEAWDERRSRRQGHRLPQGGRTPSRTRRSSSPASNIRRRRSATPPTRRCMSDPRMEEMGANMPFDGKRMIIGGFDAIVEEGCGRRRLCRRLRRPGARRQSATPIASSPRKMAKVFRQHGATRVDRSDRRRRAQRRGHRLLSRGEGRGRRRRRLLVHRMAGQGDARRGVEGDHGRREPEARRRDAVRRQAHVLGRLREDRRHRRSPRHRAPPDRA